MSPTILCVDDDEGMTNMLRDTLVPRGFIVLTAGTVKQAVEMAQHARVDLIILDLFLPDVNGLTLFDLLPPVAAGRKIPIIMASGCGSEEARNLATQRGAVAYLRKPYQIQQLLTLISWAAPSPEPPVAGPAART